MTQGDWTLTSRRKIGMLRPAMTRRVPELIIRYIANEPNTISQRTLSSCSGLHTGLLWKLIANVPFLAY